jgi:rod shape-determining protein MreD
MKGLVLVLFGLLLLTLESSLVKGLGLTHLRVDVTVILVMFMAVRANTLEGAIAAYGLGFLLDLWSGIPTGLYTFLAVLTFLGGRMVASMVDARSALSFALFTMAADAGHMVMALLLNWMRAGVLGSFTVLPLQALVTGISALLLFPLLRKMDPGTERPQIGMLR